MEAVVQFFRRICCPANAKSDDGLQLSEVRSSRPAPKRSNTTHSLANRKQEARLNAGLLELEDDDIVGEALAMEHAKSTVSHNISKEDEGISITEECKVVVEEDHSPQINHDEAPEMPTRHEDEQCGMCGASEEHSSLPKCLAFAETVEESTEKSFGVYFDIVNTSAEPLEIMEMTVGTRDQAERVKLFARKTPQRCRGAEEDASQWLELGAVFTRGGAQSSALRLREPMRFARGTVRGFYLHSADRVACCSIGSASDNNLRAEHVAEARFPKAFQACATYAECLPAGSVTYRLVTIESPRG